MAVDTGAAVPDWQNLLKKLKDPQQIKYILHQCHIVFEKLNTITRYTFSEYDQLVADVAKFKDSLLKFVRDSKIHLTLLQNNFKKPQYQEANDINSVPILCEPIFSAN